MRTLLLVLLAVAAFAADLNLSGTWQLNHQKSNFGPAKPPGNLVTRIAQQNNQLQAQSTVDGLASEYTWTLDGKESVNRIRGNEVKAIASWRGPILQVKSKTAIQGQSVSLTDQYSLSADGKTMTIYRTINGPQGEIEQTYVYDKLLSAK